jgi:hypothetical protein
MYENNNCIQDVAFQNQHRASPFPNPFITANDCNKTKLQGIINGGMSIYI